MSIEMLSFLLGGLLVIVGLLGGGIEIRELKIRPINQITRVLSLIGGIAFIGLAIFFNSSTTTEPTMTGKEPQPKPVTGDPQHTWMTSAQYELAKNKQVREGFYPHKVEGRCQNDFVVV